MKRISFTKNGVELLSHTWEITPVSGQPIWSSVQMCTVMQIIVFKADVRAQDPNLKWINDQCRRDLNEQEAHAIADNGSAALRICI